MAGELDLGYYKIHMTDKLGQGTFGVVYKGIHKTKGFKVAAKQYEVKNEKQGSIALTEIKHLQHLHNHPHIARLFDFNFKLKSFWTIMEFCDAGDLETYFYMNNPKLHQRKDIMFQCTSAIHYMHSRTYPVVHRDIKPQNIIMKYHESGAIAKVTDFGLAKTFEITDIARTLVFSTKCGTPGFMAPEFFINRNKTFGKSVDIFSLGLVFLAMTLHKTGDEYLVPQTEPIPMPLGQIMVFHNQKDLSLPDITADVPDESHDHVVIKQLIKNMTMYDANERAKVAEVEDALEDIGGSSPLALPNTVLAEDREGGNEENEEEEKEGSSPLALPNTVLAEEREGGNEKNEEEVKSSSPLVLPNTVLAEGREGGKENEEKDKEVHKPVEESSDKPSGDVGFLMVKRALQEAHKEKCGLDDDFLKKKGFGDMAQRNMLGGVLSHDRLTIGEKVMVDTDKRRVQKLQDGYGNWVDGLERYLGRYGIVVGGGRSVRVRFDNGKEHRFNPKVLFRTGEVPYRREELREFDRDMKLVKEMFKRYSIVKIGTDDIEVFKCMQQSIRAGWNPRMKEIMGTNGIVKQVKGPNEVHVEFLNDDKWLLHPDILERVDMTGCAIEAGDMVVVMNDKSSIRNLKAKFEKWDDIQSNFLDESGIVKSVVSKEQIKVDMGIRTFTWHPLLLRLWAKGEDVMSAILRNT